MILIHLQGQRSKVILWSTRYRNYIFKHYPIIMLFLIAFKAIISTMAFVGKLFIFSNFAATCTTIIRCTLECLSGPSVLWCFTVLQIKLECRQFALIFVWVMPLLELRILKIHSFPHFSLTGFDILSWNFANDSVLLYYRLRLSVLNLR